jgi:predicted regulator of Ras-like GTPase activity (Roadblock/LC7/MglB family)
MRSTDYERPFDKQADGEGMYPLDEATSATVRTELATLRDGVTGVLGSVVAGVDGLLFLNDLGPGPDPHDMAAMAAAAYGVSRQIGIALRQAPFCEGVVRSSTGYFAVYAIGDSALLAVHGDDGLNVARMHLEARAITVRLADVLHEYVLAQAEQNNIFVR